MGNDKSKNRGAAHAAKAPRSEPSSTLSALQKMKQQIAQFEKRKDFLNKKVEKETAEAKAKAKAKNKKGALSHLKRKKMLEKEVTKLENIIITLEQQAIAIESGSVNVDAVNAMQEGAKAQKAINQKLDVDDVAQLSDDIQELQAEQEEVSELLASNVAGLDDDELEAELAELGEEEVQTESTKTPGLELPTAPISAPVTTLPQVPSHKPQEKTTESLNDDQALAALQAEMGN